MEFPGCAVVTSHDRMFLDRIATHILAWEGTDENPGAWFWFEAKLRQLPEEPRRAIGRRGVEAPSHPSQVDARLGAVKAI